MKRTLLAIGITTLALAVGAVAEDQVPKRAAAKGTTRTTTATSARTSTGANVRAHQVTAHQNTSTRAFNRQATTTARERNIHRAQITTNNAAVANTTTSGRFGRREALRDHHIQQRAINNTSRNVTINRTRNVNRNVTLVNNWRSSQFAGQRYVAFRNYRRAWHDRGWWDSHYGTNLTFVFGAPYFWSSGYWYPAWGYNPGYVYPYDGPIYGAQNLSPDQVVANVQQQLQRDGYYDGPVDGVLGPQTRYALAAFQADNGLAVTSAVDEPTLATLGLA
jgi:Putative peptidoglycan binding domain